MPQDKRPITIKDLYKIAYVEDPQLSPDGSWIAYVHMTVSEAENTYERNIWLVSVNGEEKFQLTQTGKDSSPRFSPDGKTLAFVSARNEKPQIFIQRLTFPGGEPTALTAMPNGAVSPEWSPSGSRIAFLSRLSADERETEGEEIEKPEDELAGKHQKERKAHDEKMRFDPRFVWRVPYRRGTSFVDERYSQVYIIDIEKTEETKPIRLTDIEADHMMPQWSADEKYIYTTRTTDPSADEPWVLDGIYKIDIEKKETFTFIDDEYSNHAALISPDGKWLAVFRGPRENLTRTIMRLSLVSTEDKSIHDITVEMDREPAGMDWSPENDLIFTVGDQGNLEVFSVSPDDFNVKKLHGGVIETQDIAAGAGSFAFVATTPMSPPELFVKDLVSDEVTKLTEINKKLLDEVLVQETHEIRWKSTDGKEIQGWYILPVGYEEGKKYPLAFNIHGGPHVMWSPSSRSMWHEWQTHAARGYAVFYCNPRGSEGYGQEHHDGIAASWGESDLPDLMTGIDTLLDLGFVDENRMAVTGGSYGGFMTGWVISHTDRFAAAVSQRGVYNLSSFYGTSDVPFLISSEFGVEPWEDHALLWDYSPVAHAHKVTTPTLLIHAENDFRVPIEQAEQFFAFIRRSTNTPIELWRYPRDGHELSRSGEPKHRVSRLTKMIDHFDKYCMK